MYFSEAEALILDLSTGNGFLLTPFILSYPCKTHNDSENGHCYMFGKLKEEKQLAVATI
jgi:hypothetical protein